MNDFLFQNDVFLLIGSYFLIFHFCLCVIYFISADINDELPLDVHLRNQQTFIHGRDAHIYRYIPRVRL
jgi:hypothetical protein